MTGQHAEATDAQLIRAGDGAAFAELYRRHVAAVHSWLARRAPSAGAAADLAAETFAEAWLSRRRFRDQGHGTARPWLLGIAGNVARRSARRDRVETRARAKLGLPLDLAAEDGYERVDERLSRPAAPATLASLPDHERLAVELRVLDGLPYRDVAHHLNIEPAAARLRVSRALRRLAATTPREEP